MNNVLASSGVETRKAQNVRQSKCLHCPNEAVDGSIFCQVHIDIDAAFHLRIREGRKQCAIWPGAGMLQCAWPTCGCPSDVEQARRQAESLYLAGKVVGGMSSK